MIALRTDAAVLQDTLEVCRLDASSSPEWLVEALTAVAAVAPAATITGAAYVAPFFGGRFGPTQVPPEIDVAFDGDDAGWVRRALEHVAPRFRWRIVAPGSGALVVDRGSLRLHEAGPVYEFDDDRALDHLNSGVLEPDLAADTASARIEAEALLASYPGLRADFLGYDGKNLAQTVEEIEALVREHEYGGRRVERGLLPSEEPWAEAIRRWHETVRPRVEPPPCPPRAQLPEGDPWAAPDDEFREWLLAQTLCSADVAVDPELRAALIAQRGEQKPTHAGWETYQHAIAAALVLDTGEVSPADRRAARVAAVLHDIGKTHNVWTPGCHALIGAKTWEAYRPEWLTDDEAHVVRFLIRTHDMLGLLDRWIVDRGYRGGLSPSLVRAEAMKLGRPFEEAFGMMKMMYEADVGSVAALRWLLPLTPYLEQIVLAGRAEEEVAR